MTEEATAPELVEVRLLGLPVPLRQRASEHNEGLRREFQMLVEQGHAEPASVPARLVALAAELDRRLQAFTVSTRTELEEAARRGDTSIDVLIRVPAGIGPAVAQFKTLLTEADEYCASGEHLLTLAAEPDVAAFRNWVLDELVRQPAGREPIPWPDYAGGPSSSS